ncbi:MAG: hypothetical protein G01um101420_910 [Parcubacteria group bacterium Gr01-1014_20]|nr:MAG: hypothetical protein G01um101420_910 [Parcubacteria group bacterium Gr01-1014_20]
MATLVIMPMFAAFEAHVVNVTARIENALFVHPQSIEYGTVFPQEHLFSDFFLTFSQSFSETSQTRVGKVDYVIKQKPKPREAFLQEVGVEVARDFCHLNSPANVGDLNDPYYDKCFPSLCPYLSKTPDGNPATGPNANNDVGVPAFHDPEVQYAEGTIVKIPNLGRDSGDQWTINLAVPCFKGMCAQDWASFVLGLNPNAGDPAQYELPPTLEHEVFGCDLWVEVTRIY